MSMGMHAVAGRWAQIERLEGRVLLAVSTFPEYRGVNAMDIFNPSSSVYQNLSWGVNIHRQTVMDFDIAPLNTGYIEDKNLHGLQPIADQNTAAGVITIFCPFSWQGQQLYGQAPSQTPFWNAFNQRLKDMANQFKNQPMVWLELWNEPYGWRELTDPNQWFNDMYAMVSSIRSTGATNKIVVPAGQMGGGENVLIARGRDLVDADPLHNIVFDVHAYNAWYDSGAAGMSQRMDNILNAGLDFLFGEFSAGTPGGVYDVAPFLNLVTQKKIGALAWSWNAGDGSAIIRSNGTPNDTSTNFNWGTKAKNYLLGSSTVLPAGWFGADIGSPGVTGTSSFSGTTFTVRGSGADIWNSSDQFHYAAKYVAGDNVLTARITSQQNTDYWAKSGVMFRDSTAADAMFVALETTPSAGILLQARTATGAQAFNFTTVTGAAPKWLRIEKAGDVFTAYTAGTTGTPAAGDWSSVGSITADFGDDAFLGGLAVTSHTNAARSTATFSDVSLVTRTALPAGWTASDIGTPGKAGGATFDGATFAVTGSGNDIWDLADAFGFASAAATGNHAIIARLASMQKTDGWAKAGIMFRDSTAAGSAFVAVEVTPSNGIRLQGRRTTNSAAVDITSATGVAPAWLKLIRTGSTFTAYRASTTGMPAAADWIELGSISGVSFASTTFRAGLAVTAHNNATTNTARFDHVSVMAAPVVTSALINGGVAQRSKVNGATYAFSSAVTLGSNAFRLTRRSDSATFAVTATNPSGDGTTYTLAFGGLTAGSLPDGVYDLVLDAAAVTDPAGQHLAANHTLKFHRLFGDVDGNRVVNMVDYTRLRVTLARSTGDPLYNGVFDYDGNGTITVTDLAQFRRRFGMRYGY